MNINNKTLSITRLNGQQLIKLLVYCLLAINYGFYIIGEWQVAKYTLTANAGLLDWAAAFKTSIDETAWFVLLIIFELETYALSDDAFTPARVRLMHMIRCVCYVFLAHTIYANGSAVIELANEQAMGEVSLCELADKNISYTRNENYQQITSDNCANLLVGAELYQLSDGKAVTDRAGLDLAQYMSWLDLFESLSWIGIMLAIELGVRLQNKGISSGKRLRALNVASLLFYTVLWVAIGHWIYLGHYVYAWDEFVWIAGFVAIEMNMADWRKDMKKQSATEAGHVVSSA
ncbi:hypothetical protein NO559_10600 [Dasania sp. GY-MA-18]|uniref:Shikimate kinase n=1 Tax=Dasania phycosphaerae TaxID=2950436 RepID=A0A9J6RMX0_9GAMM|nr:MULTISPECIES: hypothetical protein [Dasania]MCR8923225.1 hypothetical protein [Dasania sp. GY-MA-18]MCZ0865657.1 hypothetical protein [Dasania phycosphaerae]MCZ0869382.1 hypothetical protein [Dasania phycosphaerae]